MTLKATTKGKECAIEHEKRQKLGRRSKTKGANFERDVAKKFKKAYDADLVRTPQSGGFAKKSAKADDFRGDIVPADEDIELSLHIEAKCCKQWTVPQWIAQSESDCPTGKVPVVIFHQHGTSNDYVAIEKDNFYSLLGNPPVVVPEKVSVDLEEQWKPIYGFENYQISNFGRLKSLKGKIMNPCVDSSGYLNTSLRKDGKTYSVRVHQLVAIHFLRRTDIGCVVNHIDGNKLNNRVDNLEYVTSGDNNQKAYDTGLKAKGEDHYLAKLSDKDIFDIRVEFGLGRMTYREIEGKYNVANSTVSRICSLPDYRNPYNLFLLCKNAKTWSLPAWFKQAESDCPKGKSPVVVFHQHGTSKDYIAMSLEDFFKLVPRERVILRKKVQK